jgi:hypothetical protein
VAAGGALQDSSAHSSGQVFEPGEDISVLADDVMMPLSPKASFRPGAAAFETQENSFADDTALDLLAGVLQAIPGVSHGNVSNSSKFTGLTRTSTVHPAGKHLCPSLLAKGGGKCLLLYGQVLVAVAAAHKVVLPVLFDSAKGPMACMATHHPRFFVLQMTLGTVRSTAVCWLSTAAWSSQT